MRGGGGATPQAFAGEGSGHGHGAWWQGWRVQDVEQRRWRGALRGSYAQRPAAGLLRVVYKAADYNVEAEWKPC